MNMRLNFTIALLLASFITLLAQRDVVDQQPDARQRGWGPEQATGAPDTPKDGDFITAWASLDPDAGPEWLLLDFARAVEIKSVSIFESYNPGAVSKVTVFDNNGKEITIWEGNDPTVNSPDAFILKSKEGIVTKKVKVCLETTRIPGWNEIDAVELIGTDDSHQWAVAATASSSYADPRPGGMVAIDTFGYPPGDEFLPFINRQVICHLIGGTELSGVLQRSGAQFLVLREAAKTYLINKTQLFYVELKQIPIELDEKVK